MINDYDAPYGSWYGQGSPRYDTPFSSPDRSPPVSYDDIDDSRQNRFYVSTQQLQMPESDSDNGEESYYMQHTKRQRSVKFCVPIKFCFDK